MAFDSQCISVAEKWRPAVSYLLGVQHIGASSADPVRLRNRPVGMMMGGIAEKESTLVLTSV
jgi:hypothetical protein